MAKHQSIKTEKPPLKRGLLSHDSQAQSGNRNRSVQQSRNAGGI
jgi:hypothetical protein